MGVCACEEEEEVCEDEEEGEVPREEDVVISEGVLRPDCDPIGGEDIARQACLYIDVFACSYN